jgi:hypothetical protein
MPRVRDEAFPQAEAGTFLVNSLGRPLDSRNTPTTFAGLVTAAGITAPPGQRAPRLHDLRHVFTVATLLDWYRDGADAGVVTLSALIKHSEAYDAISPEQLAEITGGTTGLHVIEPAELAETYWRLFTDRTQTEYRFPPTTRTTVRTGEKPRPTSPAGLP